MNSTEQTVHAAIDRSKIRNEIVTLDRTDGRVSGMCDILALECEGSADNGGTVEYWGEDIDGNTWRVHVEVA